jgi:predicted transcriptional regulator
MPTVSFRCPDDLVKKLEADARADHRKRSSFILKIVSLYYENKNGKKPQTRKKAGSR